MARYPEDEALTAHEMGRIVELVDKYYLNERSKNPRNEKRRILVNKYDIVYVGLVDRKLAKYVGSGAMRGVEVTDAGLEWARDVGITALVKAKHDLDNVALAAAGKPTRFQPDIVDRVVVLRKAAMFSITEARNDAG